MTLKLKVRNEGSIENRICSALWADPRTILNLSPISQIDHFSSKKPKTNPKLSQNYKSELKVAEKIKLLY